MQADSADAVLSTYPFHITLPARFTDLDATGNIGHIGLARYYEEVRSSFMHSVLEYSTRTWHTFVGRVTVQQYSYPAYPHPLSFGIGVASIGSRSYVVELAGFQQGICFARSRSVSVLVGDHGPMAVNDDVRQILAKVLLPESHFPSVGKPSPERRQLERYAHRVEFATRFSDTDALGHLNNVAHLRYGDEGRATLLAQAAASTDPRALGIVTDFDISYLREARHFALMTIGTSVRAVHADNVHLIQGLFQDGQCVATCDWELRVSEKIAERLLAMRT
jgi:acyl-CoA thioester hydrolase